MSLILSGRTFNDGEQLTAAKLNQMFADATLSTTGVDGTSIIINDDDVLAVRSINSSRIDTGAVTLSKIQEVPTNTVLGRASTDTGIVEELTLNTDDEMANASDTTLATDGSIKAYINSVDLAKRPKFVPLTGGTTDLTKTNETGSVTYEIEDFTADTTTYPDFATNKISGVVIESFVKAKRNPSTSTDSKENLIRCSLPDGTNTILSRAESMMVFSVGFGNNAFNGQVDCTTTTIPINADQTSFTLTFEIENQAPNIFSFSIIKGVIIN